MSVTRRTHSEGYNGELLNTVTVKPHQTRRLEVGIYERAMPLPGLCLQYEPDVRDDIGVAPLKLEQEGEYMLVYQVENFGDVTCSVSVRECGDGAGSS